MFTPSVKGDIHEWHFHPAEGVQRAPQAPSTVEVPLGAAFAAFFPCHRAFLPYFTPVREAFLVPDAAKHRRDKVGLHVFLSLPRPSAHLCRTVSRLRPGRRLALRRPPPRGCHRARL